MINPDAENIGVFFDTGDGSTSIIHLQTTTTDSETLIVADRWFTMVEIIAVQFNPSTDFEILLSNIGLDDRFIIAAYRPIPMSNGTGTITSGTPVITETGTQTETLTLSDFTLPSGQQLIFSALILAGGSGISIYRDPRNATAQGTLLDGDLSLTADHLVTRMRYTNSQLVFNDQPDADDIRDFFDTGGGSDATIHLQTITDSETLIVADTIASGGGGNAVQFNPSTDFETLLSNIGLDDRFIIAAYRPTPESNGTGTITSGMPVITATGTQIDTLVLSDFALPNGQELIFSALILGWRLWRGYI